MEKTLSSTVLNTIFNECRQCGICCKKYRKIVLEPSEVAFIEKMGGHVGVNVPLDAIRENGFEAAMLQARKRGKVYMIHPDDKGCIFLEQRNEKFCCKIYHYRPRTCRGFRCNLVDDSLMSLYGSDAIYLLGQNTFGLPLDDDK